MRGRVLLMALIALAAGVAACAQGGESHLMRWADVNGERIVFTYEGDLWLVSTQGGDARRITSDAGDERFAKFSPDGSKIAFTASYDGGTDVYVMDTAGGMPARLTYHPGQDLVLGWFPDGEHILFRSRREYPFRGEQLYKISCKGGMEEKLPLDRGGLASLSPDGKSIAYCRISGENATWKRHQGGDAQDLWMGSFEKADFRKIAGWKGQDNYPMWHGDFIYFTSDREAGTLNLFKYAVQSGTVTAVTRYSDYDVKYPSLGPAAIVYQYGESLYMLDLSTEQSRKVDVRIGSDRVRVRPDLLGTSSFTGSFALSPDGSRLLLESRGEILSVPAEKEKGQVYNLSKRSRSREKNAAWSPDGKWVAFLSDRTGEEELYLADPKGEKPWKQLTSDGKGFRMRPAWSPDSRYILFGDKFMRLNLVEAATAKLTVVDRSDYDDGWERWGIQDYVWSPCSRWIAYTKKMENTNEIICLYSLDTGKITPVTDDLSESWSPSFDPKGRYLYFLSNRTYNPLMGTIDQDHIFLNMARPYVLVLKAGEPSPFAPEEDGPKAEEKKPEADDGAKGKDKPKEAPKAPPVKPTVIDLSDFERRTVAAEGVEAGNYFRLEATEKGFFYLAKNDPEFTKYQVITDVTDSAADLMAYDLEEKKASDSLKGILNYHLSNDGKKLVYKTAGKFGVVDAGGKAKAGEGIVDLSEVKIQVDKLDEFAQIFDEAWRIERDWFYDPNMHGVDWNATGEKYRKFVPNCGNRSDLNYLIGEMIAELNAGHTYVYGGDLDSGGKRRGVGLLGCDFEVPPGSTFHRIRHIIPGKPWDGGLISPLAMPGCPVKEGDYLIAIDGEKVASKDNVYRFLEGKGGKIVVLTYNGKPSEEGARTYRLEALRSEYGIRYQEWVDANFDRVQKATGGKVGYIHISDMDQEGLRQFARMYYPQFTKNALVVDVRYNGGGFTGDMILERLTRKVWAMTQPREGKPCRNPEVAFYGPIVLLINEDTGSNGEFFAEAFKELGIGRVIGMRTWGGSVGIEAHQDLLDGGTVTPPQFGLYGLRNTWLIEGRGVDPEVEVQNMPGDVLQGKDAQLDAALGYVLEELRKDPRILPGPPPYPDKAKPRGSDLTGKP